MTEFDQRRHLKWRVRQSQLEQKSLYHPVLKREDSRGEILSPRFEFQNSKWALGFYANNSCTHYCLYLKKHDLNACLPFRTTCFGQCHPQTSTFSVSICESKGAASHEIWFPSQKFFAEAKDLFSVESILFIVIFDGTPLGLDSETVDKSTSTGSDLGGLASDFGNLLASGHASDVQLKCKGVTRAAHWLVLAARSEVFSAMHRTKMAESTSGVVNIEDLDATLLDLLLSYIYTGNLSDLPEDRVHELYAVADKYAVHLLQKMCSDRMVENLAAHNYQLFLVIAEAHSDEQFKSALIASITDHAEWLDCHTWLEFSKEHPVLAKDVYHELYKKTFKRT